MGNKKRKRKPLTPAALKDKLKRMLDSYGFTREGLSGCDERQFSWVFASLEEAFNLALMDKWDEVRKKLEFIAKFSKGEVELVLDAEVADWVSEYLPKILPPHWQVLDTNLNGARYQSVRGQRVILSGDREEDGRRWMHLSTSFQDRLPTWEELRDVKELFLGDRTALQVLPKKENYVNVHPYVLHLWVCLDEEVIPDFTRGAGTI
jgi:hypothetical protein